MQHILRPYLNYRKSMHVYMNPYCEKIAGALHNSTISKDIYFVTALISTVDMRKNLVDILALKRSLK